FGVDRDDRGDGERDGLDVVGASFADVVLADGDRVELPCFGGAVGGHVGAEPVAAPGGEVDPATVAEEVPDVVGDVAAELVAVEAHPPGGHQVQGQESRRAGVGDHRDVR